MSNVGGLRGNHKPRGQVSYGNGHSGIPRPSPDAHQSEVGSHVGGGGGGGGGASSLSASRAKQSKRDEVRRVSTYLVRRVEMLTFARLSAGRLKPT